MMMDSKWGNVTHSFKNITFSLFTDGLAHLLSGSLSVRVTVEKCSVRIESRDLLVTKGEWQLGHWDWLWNPDGVETTSNSEWAPHLQKISGVNTLWSDWFPLAQWLVSFTNMWGEFQVYCMYCTAIYSTWTKHNDYSGKTTFTYCTY